MRRAGRFTLGERGTKIENKVGSEKYHVLAEILVPDKVWAIAFGCVVLMGKMSCVRSTLGPEKQTESWTYDRDCIHIAVNWKNRVKGGKFSYGLLRARGRIAGWVTHPVEPST